MRERAFDFFFRIFGVERAVVRERRHEVDRARPAGFVRPAAVLAGAVERAIAAQHLRASGDHTRHLDRVFVGLGSAGREEDARAFVPGRKFRELFCQIRTHVERELRRGVGQSFGLFADRGRNRVVTVSEVHRNQPGRQVEVAIVVGIVEVDALAARHRRSVQAGLFRPGGKDVFRVLCALGTIRGYHPVEYARTSRKAFRSHALLLQRFSEP